MQIAVIIPTYNAANTIGLLLETIQQQTLKPNNILVLDCSSSDATIAITKNYNVPYHTIKKLDFNHGTTRKYATSLLNADIYIFFTQDVSLVNENAFKNIIAAFSDEKVGCAYGRQLPNKDAEILAAQLRLFAYPATSSVKSYEDRAKLGIKTCFNSDNFAAYRKKAMLDIGGFPENVPSSEDMYVAAKMLMHGWKVAYKADAMIYHSHNYTLSQEFQRFFDMGVFHAMHPWILDTFNGYMNDGIKYLHSAMVCCMEHRAYFALPKIITSAFTKWLGFYIGKHYKIVPSFIRKKISMYNYF